MALSQKQIYFMPAYTIVGIEFFFFIMFKFSTQTTLPSWLDSTQLNCLKYPKNKIPPYMEPVYMFG